MEYLPHRSRYTFSIPGVHLREWRGASHPVVTSLALAMSRYSL